MYLTKGPPQQASTKGYTKKIAIDILKVISLVCILKGISWAVEKNNSQN
jgi:hypothetical protein